MEIAGVVLRGRFPGATYGIIAIPISLVFVTTGTVDMAIGAFGGAGGGALRKKTKTRKR